MFRKITLLVALIMPAACMSPDPQTPSGIDQSEDGSCHGSAQIPAIYEQVIGEIEVIQAEIAPDGTVLRPPVYRRAPVPRLVRPRTQMRFETPCPDQVTPDFIASLQRALRARDYYSGAITGTMTPQTTTAIRHYQSERGLESGQVSLQTARALGLIEVQLPG